MSFNKRKLEHAKALWEEQISSIENDLQAQLNDVLLDLRSFKYKINSWVQLVDDNNSNKSIKIGNIVKRNLQKKKKHNELGCQVTYTIKLFQDTHQEHFKMKNVKQENIKEVNFQCKLNQKTLVKINNIQYKGIIVDRKVEVTSTNTLVRTYTIKLNHSVPKNTNKNDVTQAIILSSDKTQSELTLHNIILLNKSMFLFQSVENPIIPLTKYSFERFPVMKKAPDFIKELFYELIQIQSMSTKSTERKNFSLHLLKKDVNGSIGEYYLSDELKTCNLYLLSYMYYSMNKPMKLLNTMKVAFYDMRNNIENADELITFANQLKIEGPVDDDHAKNNLSKTVNESKKEIDSLRNKNTTNELPFKDLRMSKQKKNNKQLTKSKTLGTLELRPPPKTGWKWPCLAPNRSLRVQLDVFVENSEDYEVDSNKDSDDSDDDTEETEKERSFSTDISVDEPILSIFHFLECWYTKKDNDIDNTSSNSINNNQFRKYFGDHLELYINIRTHANEQVIRLDTINTTSNTILTTAFTSAWDVQHKSGSIDTGLSINISAICTNMCIIPALCVTIRVHDREYDPLIRVNMPIGVSLVHARQLITDCVQYCTDCDNDASGDSDDSVDNIGPNIHHEWQELQALAKSNDYTFSKQGASVLKILEKNMPALKLSVIEGSRVFHQHSQSEELCLVCIPSM